MSLVNQPSEPSAEGAARAGKEIGVIVGTLLLHSGIFVFHSHLCCDALAKAGFGVNPLVGAGSDNGDRPFSQYQAREW